MAPRGRGEERGGEERGGKCCQYCRWVPRLVEEEEDGAAGEGERREERGGRGKRDGEGVKGIWGRA